MSEETDDIDDRFATGCTPPGSFCYGADFTVNGKPVHRIDRPQEVERLDYNKPPPSFIFPHLDRSLQMDVLTTGVWGPRELAAGWSCCKAMLDPPGMYVDGIAWGLVAEVATVPGGNAATSAAARAAAWAWYDDALEVAARLDAAAVLLVEHGDGGACHRVPTVRSRIVDALQPMLTIGTDEDDRALAVAEAERLFSEGRLDFEGDQPIELETVTAWPAALTWTTDQRAAVRRWLAEGGETPEVLRG